jgi:hypothetical protein
MGIQRIPRQIIEMTDVGVAAPIDGQVMRYDATAGKWLNTTDVSVLQRPSPRPPVKPTWKTLGDDYASWNAVSGYGAVAEHVSGRFSGKSVRHTTNTNTTVDVCGLLGRKFATRTNMMAKTIRMWYTVQTKGRMTANNGMSLIVLTGAVGEFEVGDAITQETGTYNAIVGQVIPASNAIRVSSEGGSAFAAGVQIIGKREGVTVATATSGVRTPLDVARNGITCYLLHDTASEEVTDGATPNESDWYTCMILNRGFARGPSLPVSEGRHFVEWSTADHTGTNFDWTRVDGFMFRIGGDKLSNVAGVIDIERIEIVPVDASVGWVHLDLDDGFREQYLAALYGIARGVPITIGISPDCLDQEQAILEINPAYDRVYMTWDEVLELQQLGVELVVHAGSVYGAPYASNDVVAYCRRLKEMFKRPRITLTGKRVQMNDAGADILIIPTGTVGNTPHIAQRADIEAMATEFALVRGTRPFWTGAGHNNPDLPEFEQNDGGGLWFAPKNRLQNWWTWTPLVTDLNAVVVDDGEPNAVNDYLLRAKAHGACLVLYSHFETEDIALTNWNAMIDRIAGQVDAGNIKVVTLSQLLAGE